MNDARRERGEDVFYEAMNEFYYKDDSGKHDSPTRRLISHKNTTFEHKGVMKNKIQNADYQLVYTGAEKSYVVAPHEGELNYKLAEKNPLKFYDQVLNQDVTRHAVRENKQMKKDAEEKHKAKEEEKGSPIERKKQKFPVEVASKVTKRPHMKIMDKLRMKIAAKLKEKMGDTMGENIFQALKAKQVEGTVKDMLKQEKIKLLDNETKQPMYRDQIKEVVSQPIQVKKKTGSLAEKRDIKMSTDTKVQGDKYLNVASPISSDEGVSPEVRSKTHLVSFDGDRVGHLGQRHEEDPEQGGGTHAQEELTTIILNKHLKL